MNALILIQARRDSTRLPNKVLMPLGDKTVLRHVVDRCRQASPYVAVVCPERDKGHLTLGGNVSCIGHPDLLDNDVLARYAYAVRAWEGSHIVRITADCPCLDPALIRQAVEALEAGHDYAGNTVERHWPRGLDVETFTTELLLKAHQTATDPYDREHVTPWMQRWASHPYALPAPEPDRGLERFRWCLDTPQDRSWLERAFMAFPDPTTEQLLTLPPRYD